MVQPTLADFPGWNNSHPLVVLTNSLVIPQAAFKFLPKYDGSGKMPYEHYQDMSLLASSFDINDETIMMRLLSYSFEGKVVKWLNHHLSIHKYMGRVILGSYQEIC